MTQSRDDDQVTCPYCQHQEVLPSASSDQELTCSACGAAFHSDQIAATVDPATAVTVVSNTAATISTTLSDAATVKLTEGTGSGSSVGPATAPTLIAGNADSPPFGETRQMPSSGGSSTDGAFGIEPARSEIRFRIHGEIARGGMGAILKSRDVYLRREVAMKVILGSGVSQTQLRRFVEEAQITGQLEHPSIVPVHELGIDQEGKYYYTMKMVHGHTLKDILRDLAKAKAETVEEYPLARLLDVFNRICDALAFAHSRGIIHRDLKPENIMIGDFGEVQVMDWGLAKIVADEAIDDKEERPPTNQTVGSMRGDDNADKTQDGNIVGTPQYMAPEQARGDIAALCAQTDIYALGAILYQILTLRPPVSGKSIRELLNKVISGDITPPIDYNSSTASRSQHAADQQQRTEQVQRAREIVLSHCPHHIIPVSLSAVCMRAMQTKIEDRYTSVEALQKDIQSYQQGFATDAEDASALRQIALLIKRHKAACSLIAGSLLVIVLIVIVFVHNLQIKERIAVEEKGKAQAATKLADSEKEKAELALANAEYSIYRMAIKDAQRHIESAFFSDAQQSLSAVNPVLRQWEYYHLQERISSRSLQNILTLTGHSEGVTALKIAPNQNMIASASENGEIKLWRLAGAGAGAGENNTLLKTITYENGAFINDISFSPDGNVVAAADKDKGIQVWDIKTGTLIKALEGVQIPAVAVRFTPDGKQLLGAGLGWKVHVWNTETWEEERAYTYTDWIARMELSPDGKSFAVVHGNASLAIYDVATNQRRAYMPRDIDYLRDHCMVFTKDGSKLISAGEDKKIKIWDTKTGALLKELSGHASVVATVALSHDEKYIASGSDDHTIRLWDMETGEVVHIDQGHSQMLMAVLFTADDSHLLSASLDQTIKLWQMPQAEQRTQLAGRKSLLEHSQFTRDGSQLLTTSDKDEIQIWETKTGKLLKNLGTWAHKTWLVKYAPNEIEIAIFSQDTLITIIDAASGKTKMELKGHTHWPSALEYAPNGKYLASACSAPTFKIWDCETGGLLHDIKVEKGVSMVCFSPDSKTLVVSNHLKLYLYDVVTGTVIREFDGNPEEVGKMIFTHDGSRVITGGWNHVINVWNVQTGACEMTMKGHYSWVDLLEITPDGKRLVSGSYDNSVIIWDLETGKEMLNHKVTKGLMGSKISGDGKSIYIILDDNTIETLRAPMPVEK